MYQSAHYLLGIDNFDAVQVSEYSEEKGRVDYFTLSKCIGYVFNFECISHVYDWEYYNFQFDDYCDWCLIGANAFAFLKKNNEAVAYSPSTRLYAWGIPCVGKSWKLELTSIDFKNEQVTEI